MTIRIGLALGGGGARGLGHIPIVEALDEMGLRPAAIAGTSIGAIIGSGVAAGLTGHELRLHTLRTFDKRTEILARLWRMRPDRISKFLQPRLTQFDPEKVLAALLPEDLPETFDQLEIPLTVMASDFYGWNEVALSSGPLLKGVAASSALPILFSPVEVGDRLLIDGGPVNPLPFDRLPRDLDLIIAVDVVGGPEPRDQPGKPSAAEVAFGTVQLVLQTIIREKLRHSRPDVLIRPDINAFKVLDFMKAASILEAADRAKDKVKRDVERAIRSLEAA